MIGLGPSSSVACLDADRPLGSSHAQRWSHHRRDSHSRHITVSGAKDMPADHGDVTRLLSASASGSTEARDRLVALIHEELHGMARARMRSERIDHTLGATALVNETFLRLFKNHGLASDSHETQTSPLNALPWADRRAFFANAATVMRRVLIDHARARNTDKRTPRDREGGIRVEADAITAAQQLDPHNFIALSDAIDRLIKADERAAQVTRLRFFAGLDIPQIAELLEVSERTVKRDWKFARIWLHDALHSEQRPSDDQADVE